MSVKDQKKPPNLVKLLVDQAAAMFLMLFPLCWCWLFPTVCIALLLARTFAHYVLVGRTFAHYVLVGRQKLATPGAGAVAAGALVEIRRWKRRRCSGAEINCLQHCAALLLCLHCCAALTAFHCTITSQSCTMSCQSSYVFRASGC